MKETITLLRLHGIDSNFSQQEKQQKVESVLVNSRKPS